MNVSIHHVGLTLWIAHFFGKILMQKFGYCQNSIALLASLPFFTHLPFIVNDDSILVVIANGGSALPLNTKLLQLG